MAAHFLANRGMELLHVDLALEEISARLYTHLLVYLSRLVELQQPPSAVDFIRDHLLFTVLGILTRESEGIVVAAGDGSVLVDEHVYQRDENNAPSYVAYNLMAVSQAPAAFDIYQLARTWRRVGIASDGFAPELFGELNGLVHPRSLQRQLNRWSNEDKRFRDDATVVLLERLAGGRDAGEA